MANLITIKSNNRELAAASGEIVNFKGEKIYRLREFEMSERDREVIARRLEPLTPIDRLKLKYFEEKEKTFGAITPLLHDRKIRYIFAERFGLPALVAHEDAGVIRTNIIFGSEALRSQIEKLARRFGSRDKTNFSRQKENLIASAVNGEFFGVRIIGHEAVRKKLMYPRISAEALAYLLWLVSEKQNILIVGPKGSGKTDLSWFLAKHADRIATIEDFPKIVLDSKNWMSFIKSRHYSTAQLVAQISRLSPRHILFDELSGEEAGVLFDKNLNAGVIATLYLDNFEYLVDMLTGKRFGLPKSALANVDAIVSIGFGKVRGKRTALVNEIIEVTGYDIYKNKISINTVFRWNGTELKAFQSKRRPNKNLEYFRRIARKEL